LRFAQIVFLLPRPSKCTEIVGGWGFDGSTQTPLGELTALPPDPLAGLRGPTSKGPTSKGRGGEGRGGEGFYCVIVLEG